MKRTTSSLVLRSALVLHMLSVLCIFLCVLVGSVLGSLVMMWWDEPGELWFALDYKHLQYGAFVVGVLGFFTAGFEGLMAPIFLGGDRGRPFGGIPPIMIMIGLVNAVGFVYGRVKLHSAKVLQSAEAMVLDVGNDDLYEEPEGIEEEEAAGNAAEVDPQGGQDREAQAEGEERRGEGETGCVDDRIPDIFTTDKACAMRAEQRGGVEVTGQQEEVGHLDHPGEAEEAVQAEPAAVTGKAEQVEQTGASEGEHVEEQTEQLEEAENEYQAAQLGNAEAEHAEAATRATHGSHAGEAVDGAEESSDVEEID